MLSVVLNSSLAVVSFHPPVYGAECVDYYIVTAISEETDITCTASSVDLIHECSIPPNTNVNDYNFTVYSVTSGVDGALYNGSITPDCSKFFYNHVQNYCQIIFKYIRCAISTEYINC